MPFRKTVLANGQIYHVFNRSIGRRPIFADTRGLQRFYDLIDYYSFPYPPIRFSHFKRLAADFQAEKLKLLKSTQKRMVDILAFAIMPNHYHLVLRQTENKGISSFLRKMQDGYAKYFNFKSDQPGSVFQAMFKGIRIETEEQLIHVIRYVHLNPVTGYILDGVIALAAYP